MGTGEWLKILQQCNNSQSPNALVINATHGLLGKGKVGNTLILRNNLQGHWVEKVRMGGLALFCKLLAAFILCEGRCVKNFQMHVYERI